MKFKELNPSVVELASANIFYRVQSVRARSSNVVINGVSLPPVGLMSSRFCLSDEPVAYLADSQETALYESLLRRQSAARCAAYRFARRLGPAPLQPGEPRSQGRLEVLTTLRNLSAYQRSSWRTGSLTASIGDGNANLRELVFLKVALVPHEM